MAFNYGFEGEPKDDEICFYIWYDHNCSKRTKPLYLSMDALGNLSHDELKYNIIQGIPYLTSSPSSTWRLSLQDGEDFVDINNRKYISFIWKVASHSVKVILNVKESSTVSPVGFDSDRKLEAELKLQQAESSYESFQEVLSPKHGVDYHKPMHGIQGILYAIFDLLSFKDCTIELTVRRRNPVQILDFAVM